ncbi:TetR/AcrR family transcriptional regulator [Rhodococcus sp. AD45-ID]|jgi:AcrR family transcriptional regulator|uniref:TetR family transcriptional regulator n=1 Tax=Nocardia globerula TaxID=1818 RepID=A0A652YJ44_NOCGL|nr:MULTISPECIES: TetR/AcrR family transcriptional regulator [Rhodococcus]NMD63731.1 TetR/AcrR family transcriptional regulator [Nocardia globerula]KJF21749.1 transcriptional regulator BetI [Rhodococcus sp. AD45]MCE4267468.1 TetR/AcrR family transcriptional regulator [Rhodococcus globerulus]PSR39476.1 TetR/AcrR family transcriptional regulator [Rhodococcus sp. AD45-ID]PVX66554.1 TetR family transcriptional regulator [Rhodococcus globerulus]
MGQELKRERSDAARNRRAILDVTESLLAQFGAEHVSIDQIATAAGVGKGTIFHRFGSRAGLMRALVLERAQTLRDAVNEGDPPLGPGAPASDRLLAFFDAMFRLIVDNVELMIAYDNATTDSQAEEINAFWHRHITELLKVATPDVDAVVMSRVLLSVLNPDVVLHHIRTRQTERLAASVHGLVAAVVAQS